ncbi:MAG: lipid-binding SYLF domain-containing protein [Deltaproteobacteria bacterium]|nr:lipid-binding SYLF domain-containing protein [Deltaproteobacteria bacterium]
MRKIIAVAAILASVILFTSPSFAGKSEGTERISDSVAAFNDLMESDETAIPEEILAKCKAVAIFPGMKKIGWGIGAMQGFGLVMAKDEKGEWSAPAFFRIRALNTGLQIGVQVMDTVIAIMDEKGLKSFMSGDFGVGVDAAVAAGPAKKRKEATTTADLEANLLSYSKVKRGLYAGVAIEGSRIVFQEDDTAAFYGQKLKASEILTEKKVPMPGEAKPLAEALTRAAKPPAKEEKPEAKK